MFTENENLGQPNLIALLTELLKDLNEMILEKIKQEKYIIVVVVQKKILNCFM